MDHRKITLDPEELRKLSALLKEEEAKVEELTDAELEEAEKALALRVRKLTDSHLSPQEINCERETMDADWQKIQKQLKPLQREEGEDAKVVPISQKKKVLPWGTIGILAVAALVLLVLYPNIQRNDPKDLSDPSNMQVKGGPGAGYPSFCDVDVIGSTPDSVEEAGNGMAYDVRVHETFHISLLCDQAGYVHLWSNGSPAVEVRNVLVERNVRTAITQEGRTIDLNLRGEKGAVYGVALTDKKIDTEVNLFDSPIPAVSFGKIGVLWSDSVNIRGRSR